MHRPAPRTLKNQSNFLIHYSFRTVMACSFNSCAYLIGAHPDWAASLPLLSAVPAGCKSHLCSSLCLAAWAGSNWAITHYHMAREEADVAYPSCQAYFLGFHHHNNLVTCKDNQESEPTAFTCFFTGKFWQDDCKHFCTIMFASEAVLDTSKADKTS